MIMLEHISHLADRSTENTIMQLENEKLNG